MAEETTLNSSDYDDLFDEFWRKNLTSTTVSREAAASTAAEEPIRQSQEEIESAIFNLCSQSLSDYQIEEVVNYYHRTVNPPETYNWYPQPTHIQHPANIPQLTDGPLLADSQPPALVSARRQSTEVVVPQQLQVKPFEEYNEIPGHIPHPALEQPALDYIDFQRAGPSSSGQCVPGYSTDSCPLVEQWHSQAAMGAPNAAACEKEYNVSQAEMGPPSVSNYQNVPPLSANSPKKKIKGKKYTCPCCSQMTTDMGSHFRRRNSDERPFECRSDGCFKKFAEKWELQRHIRLHTMERTYQCPFCERSFAGEHHLEVHKLTHIKLEPPQT